MSVRLPSFFVVGVQKAGTTTLHNWLSLQPRICLPVIKETHFFSHLDRYVKGIDWYLSQFPAGGSDSIFGEVDPDYAFYAQTPHRIKTYMADPKIVFVFRHPIRRALSHFRMSRQRGFEKLSFVEALMAEERRSSSETEEYPPHYSYLARGRYAEQVLRYRDLFPDSEFLFLKFDDLFDGSSTAASFQSICEFIGLESAPIMPDITLKLNPASEPRSALVQRLLFRSSPLRRLIGHLIPSSDTKLALALWLERLNRSPAKRTAESGPGIAIPSEILQRVEQEILELESLTGLMLEDWLTEDLQKPGT